MNTDRELPKHYEPADMQAAIFEQWIRNRVFSAAPDERGNRYVIMMPLPNITGALHMGHAMDNVMQDLLTRWHRMMGDNTLWMPGTDHAGIATQAVVEKRLFELEGKTRHDIGRGGLVRKIQEWKNQFQARIVRQLQMMGCSCAWDRQRFTMDAVCARAVQEAFFKLFRDSLICRGDRLVNWDCHLMTAVADDEIVYESHNGHFWHLRYPVIDPKPGEPEYVVVATTRPETMLGDTAVACSPDPESALQAEIERLVEKMDKAPAREKNEIRQEIDRVEQRRKTHLPLLLQLAEMARDGRKVMLPLLNREIPLIADEWAKPELGSGCVKITPAHDNNDYQVWQRHSDEMGIINILNPNGTLNANAGPYSGVERFEARKKVIADLEALGLIHAVEEHVHDIGMSDRSKTPIEPFLSKQWFVRMGDIEGGVICGRGTQKEFFSPGLAQAAIDAVEGEWTSPSGRKLVFHPDPVRYGNMYCNWLAEKRDWCISRQLWWGHQIPIWHREFKSVEDARSVLGKLPAESDDVCIRLTDPRGRYFPVSNMDAIPRGTGPVEIQVCLRNDAVIDAFGKSIEKTGLARDPDVLDTWFSSALWPFSTLGWPDPETAQVEEGQSPLGASGGVQDCLSYYYPGSCLVTGRDIITLWVARMVIMGLYNLGDLPFTDVFVHANVLDGKGERMSKSKGNGIDPEHIVERYGADAMRYVICDMQTGTQDIRLPVQAISPFTGKLIDLGTAKHGRTIFTYICPESGKEFDVLGTMPDLPIGKVISDRFEVGRNFCNKLWNAVRFALMNLDGYDFQPLTGKDLALEDRWILIRLAEAIEQVSRNLGGYNPSAAIGTARDFFWTDLCDWYIEIVKPRLNDPSKAPAARVVLAFAVDQTLRLLHPFIPFVTETLWRKLNETAPVRGLYAPLPASEMLITAAWPVFRFPEGDTELVECFTLFQEVVRAVREIRSSYTIPRNQAVDVLIKAGGHSAAILDRLKEQCLYLASLSSLDISETVATPPLSASKPVRDMEIFVRGVIDPVKEKARLEKQFKQVLSDFERARKRLENENFVQKAGPEKVEEERRKLEELEVQLNRIEASLSEVSTPHGVVH